MWADSIFWLAAVAAFVALEAATTALVSIWFAAGALAALILSFFPVGFGWQLLLFAIVAAVTLAVMVPQLAARRAAQRPPVTNGSPLTIGKQGTVLRELQPGTLGRVRVDGLDWQARAEGPLPQGSACRVVDVDGFILIVEPVAAAPATAQ